MLDAEHTVLAVGSNVTFLAFLGPSWEALLLGLESVIDTLSIITNVGITILVIRASRTFRERTFLISILDIRDALAFVTRPNAAVALLPARVALAGKFREAALRREWRVVYAPATRADVGLTLLVILAIVALAEEAQVA